MWAFFGHGYLHLFPVVRNRDGRRLRPGRPAPRFRRSARSSRWESARRSGRDRATGRGTCPDGPAPGRWPPSCPDGSPRSSPAGGRADPPRERGPGTARAPADRAHPSPPPHRRTDCPPEPARWQSQHIRAHLPPPDAGATPSGSPRTRRGHEHNPIGAPLHAKHRTGWTQAQRWPRHPDPRQGVACSDPRPSLLHLQRGPGQSLAAPANMDTGSNHRRGREQSRFVSGSHRHRGAATSAYHPTCLSSFCRGAQRTTWSTAPIDTYRLTAQAPLTGWPFLFNPSNRHPETQRKLRMACASIRG